VLFNSYIFIFVFLPITLIIFFGLAKSRLIKAAQAWLILSSLFFYAYSNIYYLPLLIISILFNYQIGRLIVNVKSIDQQRKVLLWVGIVVNLCLLGYYKYANFFVSSFNQTLQTNWTIPKIIWPLGISFYTFTQIAYLVDTYRGDTKNAHSDFLSYSLFVSFFPNLTAGPILRHNQLVPQLHQRRTFIFTQKNLALGLTLFILGLSKKVLIADNLSSWVTPVFEHTSAVSFIEAWVGTLSYTFQLYFDFSGYSDMAIGLGLMFNISLPINFNSPYKATSISDFWRRWHITLSNFLRDYLYIPLGGSRQGEIRRYTNLVITMLLGGLWHGAGWTFVIWGGLHGVYLSINHWWRKINIPLPKLLAWVVTFLAIVISWVLFRSHSLHDATEILQTMIGMKGIILPGEPEGKLSLITHLGIQLKSWKDLVYLPEINNSKSLALIILIALTIGVRYLPNTQQILQKFEPTLSWIVGLGILACFSLLSLNRVAEFLYYQF